MRTLITIGLLTSALLLGGCVGDDDNGDDNNNNSNNNNNNGGGCEGPILDCPLGSLSEDQFRDACDLFLSSIDDPPGTEYECTSGDFDGLSLTVASRAECYQSQPPDGCSLTFAQEIACYKAAKIDACAAFDGGACAVFLDPPSSCT